MGLFNARSKEFDGYDNYNSYDLSQYFESLDLDNGLFVLGGSSSYEDYRIDMFKKHIEQITKRSNVPTIILYNEKQGSHKVQGSLIDVQKQNSNMLIIDKQYPYYHPLLGLDSVEVQTVIETLSANQLLIGKEKAVLNGILKIMESEHVPIKLHSLLYYYHLTVGELVNKCKKLNLRSTELSFNGVELSDFYVVNSILEKLNKLTITKTSDGRCYCNVVDTIKNKNILCINVADKEKEVLDLIGAELSAVSSYSYLIVLYNVNAKSSETLYDLIKDRESISVYASHPTNTFDSLDYNNFLARGNTILFNMIAKTAEDITDVYGTYDRWYKTSSNGSHRQAFHIFGGYHNSTSTVKETVNRIEGSLVSSLKDPYECFIIQNNEIVKQHNLKY